jgi:hypothetical protein
LKIKKHIQIHKELASLSIITLPGQKQLDIYTEKVKKLNLFYRISLTNSSPRINQGCHSLCRRGSGNRPLFSHVVYIIKENKTYDQVFGDIKRAMAKKAYVFTEKTLHPTSTAWPASILYLIITLHQGNHLPRVINGQMQRWCLIM